MNVSLTRELETLVNEKVREGYYTSASEVIREALRLFQRQNQVYEIQLKELRRDINLGLKAADAGELIPAEEVFKDIRKRKAPPHKRK